MENKTNYADYMDRFNKFKEAKATTPRPKSKPSTLVSNKGAAGVRAVTPSAKPKKGTDGSTKGQTRVIASRYAATLPRKPLTGTSATINRSISSLLLSKAAPSQPNTSGNAKLPKEGVPCPLKRKLSTGDVAMKDTAAKRLKEVTKEDSGMTRKEKLEIWKKMKEQQQSITTGKNVDQSQSSVGDKSSVFVGKGKAAASNGSRQWTATKNTSSMKAADPPAGGSHARGKISTTRCSMGPGFSAGRRTTMRSTEVGRKSMGPGSVVSSNTDVMPVGRKSMGCGLMSSNMAAAKARPAPSGAKSTGPPTVSRIKNDGKTTGAASPGKVTGTGRQVSRKSRPVSSKVMSLIQNGPTIVKGIKGGASNSAASGALGRKSIGLGASLGGRSAAKLGSGLGMSMVLGRKSMGARASLGLDNWNWKALKSSSFGHETKTSLLRKSLCAMKNAGVGSAARSAANSCLASKEKRKSSTGRRLSSRRLSTKTINGLGGVRKSPRSSSATSRQLVQGRANQVRSQSSTQVVNRRLTSHVELGRLAVSKKSSPAVRQSRKSICVPSRYQGTVVSGNVVQKKPGLPGRRKSGVGAAHLKTTVATPGGGKTNRTALQQSQHKCKAESGHDTVKESKANQSASIRTPNNRPGPSSSKSPCTRRSIPTPSRSRATPQTRKDVLAKTPPRVTGDRIEREEGGSPSAPKTRRSTFEKEPEFLTPDIASTSPSPRTPRMPSIGRTPKNCKSAARVRFAQAGSVGHTPRGSTLKRTPAKSRISSKEMAMREKLNAWLVAKGKTPTRYRHLMCFLADKTTGHEVPVTGGLSLDELSHQQEELTNEEHAPSRPPGLADPIKDKVQEVLSECLLLLDTGCPVAAVDSWLVSIEQSYTTARRQAAMWVCRAKIAEAKQEDDNDVIGIFEQAARNNAQPAEDIAEALKSFVERMGERHQSRQLSAHTPRKSAPPGGILTDNMFESSSIKYCYTQTTPYFKRLKSNTSRRSHQYSPRAVITPVRRSTRRSCVNLPSMLQDHDVIVDSLDDLPDSTKSRAILMNNLALDEDSDSDL